MTGTVWDAVLRHVAHTPLAVAVRGDGEDVTYAQLADRAGALRDRLAAHCRPGDVVALTVGRSSAAVPVLLAAAALRCPVLPLSADSPPLHREFVLSDAAPRVLVAEEPDDGLSVRPLTEGAPAGAPAGTDGGRRDAEDDAAAEDAAYIMYTSGSTGRPKGVVVPHESLLSRLDALAKVPGFGPGDSMLALTAPSFDISMAELLMPLAVGGTVVSAPAAARLDPAVFADTVRRHRPSVVQATPSFWRLVLAWGWTGAPHARLWSGGEALTPSLADPLAGLGAQAWNLYGPTEATIWATAARVEAGRPVYLGEPLPGARLYLEGEDGAPVDGPGALGEIMLYGEGLARGYLHRPELTADRFRIQRTPDGERRCYRTGDRARRLPDGRLEFVGRVDGQVKLRGHRIEPSEVEAVAEEQPGVHQAAVVLRSGEGGSGLGSEPHLALFAVAAPGLTARDVRRWLADRLPPPMRPARVRLLPALPRTPAGKIDRVRLAQEP